MEKNLQEDCSISIHGKTYPCPISMAMALMGGKWKGVILYYLMDGEKRYSELRRLMPTITEMTLSLQLKQLEKDQLLFRQVYGERAPLKVVYELTDFGKTFVPVLQAIGAWSKGIQNYIDV